MNGDERARLERVEVGRVCKCGNCDCCKELKRELIVRAYESAYYRANGVPCQIVRRPGGWYAISKPGAVFHGAQLSCYRLGELPELTANLNARHPARRGNP